VSSEVIGIVKRIRKEISELYKIKDSVLRRWKKTLKDEDYLGSVAFDLQSFYQGVERSFEIIAKAIDRSVPGGEKWHKMLLEQMSNEIPGIRPAVISTETRDALDQFRMFRHRLIIFIRSILYPKGLKAL
jgi:hypothetical protein